MDMLEGFETLSEVNDANPWFIASGIGTSPLYRFSVIRTLAYTANSVHRIEVAGHFDFLGAAVKERDRLNALHKNLLDSKVVDTDRVIEDQSATIEELEAEIADLKESLKVQAEIMKEDPQTSYKQLSVDVRNLTVGNREMQEVLINKARKIRDLEQKVKDSESNVEVAVLARDGMLSDYSTLLKRANNYERILSNKDAKISLLNNQLRDCRAVLNTMSEAMAKAQTALSMTK